MRKKENTKKYFWVDWLQLFLIGLTAPLFLFPSMKYVWIFLIIPMIWTCRRIIKKRFFARTVLDWALVILLIQVFATCVIVPDLGFSLPKIAGVLLGLAFFYSIVALLTTEKLIKWGIIAFLGAGLILSVVGILGMQWNLADDFEKIANTFENILPKINWNLPGAKEGFNPNAIGGTLTLIIPLCLGLLFSHIKKSKKNHLISYKVLSLIIFFVIIFVTFSVLFFTQSIGSWIGLIIGIWILLLPWKWKKLSLILILLLGAAMFLLNFDKATSTFDVNKQKLLGREFKWIIGIKTVSQNPFFGIGMNRLRQLPSMGYTTAHAHNHFIHTGAELGIPGLIAYLAILIGAGYMCFEIWRKSKIGWMRIATLGLGGGQLAHFIFGMSDSIPLGAKVGIFFWFSLGLITAMYNYMLRRNEQIKTDD